MNKTKIHKKFFVMLVIVSLFSSVFEATQVYALTKAQLEAEKSKYAAQATAAKQLAEKKKREAVQVEQQITAVNGQIGQTESALNSTAQNIELADKNVKELRTMIEEKEKYIAETRTKLNQVVSSWYMESEYGLLETVLESKNISDVATKQQYYDSVKQQIEGMAEKLSQEKQVLEAKKKEQDTKLTELNELQKSQSDQMDYLEDRKIIKNRLLSNTYSAVENLQDEQAEAEAKVAELQVKINQIRSSSAGGGGDLTSGSASWYYQQNDSRWDNYKIGRYASLGDYGCLLTSLTMIANYYGKSYNPMTAAQASSFSSNGSLISTPIVRDGKSQAIDWGLLDDELSNNHPVVVGVALGVDMGNSFGVSHFVVVKSKLSNGKYEILDPLGPGRGYYKSQVKAMRIIRP